MIREYAPIALIPAAWMMTFATVIYPGIDTYWIQHMHYFMLLFLTGFTVLSWKQMGSDPVLNIWRKVIGAGIIFTFFGALSFTSEAYSQILGLSSLTYWFLAPGLALYHSSKHIDQYSGLYRKLGGESVVGFTVFLLGIYSEIVSLQVIALIGIAVIQTVSILFASKLDN
jgi:hypothetical protein